MKKLFSIISFLFSIICFAQLPSEFDFDEYSNPNSKNELSLYFENLIPKKLLKNIRSSSKKGNVIVAFNFNTDNEIYDIKTNCYDTELKKIIIEGFQNYPIEKLKINDIDSKKNYTLQIISKRNSRYTINCSSKVTIDSQPICINCEDLNNYPDLRDCFLQEIEKHFYTHFNFDLVKNNDLKNGGRIAIKFKVLKNGELINIKSKNQSKLFANEFEKILSSFKNIKLSRTINGTPRTKHYAFTIFHKPNEIPKYREKNKDFDNYSQPNSYNEISKFFSDNLSTELISKSNLNRLNSKFLIYFNLDKNNNPIDIQTNSRSKELENTMVSTFKKYPSEKLPLQNKNNLNSYIFQVLSYANNETIVNCSSNISFERAPIYKGCENSINKLESKKCLNKKLQLHVAKTFNADKIDYTNLSGIVKINCQFKFTKTGKTSIINIKAPNVSIKLAVLKVIQSIPKLKMPGIQNGEPVDVYYMLPISFHVEKPKTKKP